MKPNRRAHSGLFAIAACFQLVALFYANATFVPAEMNLIQLKALALTGLADFCALTLLVIGSKRWKWAAVVVLAASFLVLYRFLGHFPDTA